MSRNVHCPVCDYEYTHILGTIQVKDNDDYQTTELIINQVHSIPAKVKYKFRSQGNFHMLFRCEDGHFFIKSFDGHKGIVVVDDNPLMEELAEYLNKVYENQKKLTLSIDYELLGNIDKFLKSKQID